MEASLGADSHGLPPNAALGDHMDRLQGEFDYMHGRMDAQDAKIDTLLELLGARPGISKDSC